MASGAPGMSFLSTIGQSASHIVEMVNSQRPPGENAPAPHMKSLVNAVEKENRF